MTAIKVPSCRGSIDLTHLELTLCGRLDGGIEWSYVCPQCARTHHEQTTPAMLLRLIEAGVPPRWAWDHWPLIFEVADDVELRTRARKH